MAKASKVGMLARAETKAAFAERLSSLTSFTSKELKDLFPAKSDRDELEELMKIVKSSSDENAKKAALIGKVNKVAGALIKVGQRFEGESKTAVRRMLEKAFRHPRKVGDFEISHAVNREGNGTYWLECGRSRK